MAGVIRGPRNRTRAFATGIDRQWIAVLAFTRSATLRGLPFADLFRISNFDFRFSSSFCPSIVPSRIPAKPLKTKNLGTGYPSKLLRHCSAGADSIRKRLSPLKLPRGLTSNHVRFTSTLSKEPTS